MKRAFPWFAPVGIGLVITVAAGYPALMWASQEKRSRAAPTHKPKQVQLDLDKATAVSIPTPAADLKPVAFKTADRREGWALRIPGNRPIATPAYDAGKLFVGGGYGSHEFYAFNAQTGDVVWKIQTKDDGPTAAVVEDGYVAFNTESCTVCVVEERTGHVVWEEWLGDPLMSQPAIAKGRLYIAYPAGQRGHGQHQGQINQSLNVPNQAAAPGNESGYRLLCADLRTGDHLWERPITADVISAPIIEGDRVLIACQDGTSFSLDAATGAVIWKKKNDATSAPLLANGQVVLTTRHRQAGQSYEGMKRLDAKAGETQDRAPLAMSKAEYFESGKSVVLSEPAQKTLDSSVGFGGGAPAGAEMHKAKSNLGVNTVAGGWAYQGSRAAYAKGQLMNAQGKKVNSLNAKSGRVVWQAEAKGRGVDSDAQIFSPPALGGRNLYLCTAMGHLISIGQDDGKVSFLYATNQPMTFQPALAKGNVYAGTANGMLICLKTGSKDADGWTAWGGNAQHNKKN